MYTKDFQCTSDNISIPEKYGGTAFDGERTEIHNTETEECGAHESKNAPPKFSGIFSKKLFDFSSFPFFKDGKLNIGSEEIIILALAALFFFSKDGDRECALILLLTLFLN